MPKPIFIKKSERKKVKISLIFLDWSVRESFHILDYLRRQNIDRDLFEVIFIEFYSQVSPLLKKHDDMVDTWITLGFPSQTYYHKHMMYNVGILASHGEICLFSDSDAMVKETFLESILQFFSQNKNAVLHLEQIRNYKTDLYPFNYPSFEEVLGEGCVNWHNGKSTRLSSKKDIIHQLNYGACMAALKKDIIAIGGVDESKDYLGHICGPYDMTFRLQNLGRQVTWHQSEFTYHTWHPGSDGYNNYFGPSDGLNISLTSLESIVSGRVLPFQENPYIKIIRTEDKSEEESFNLSQQVEITSYLKDWTFSPTQSSNKTSQPFGAPSVNFSMDEQHCIFYTDERWRRELGTPNFCLLYKKYPGRYPFLEKLNIFKKIYLKLHTSLPSRYLRALLRISNTRATTKSLELKILDLGMQVSSLKLQIKDLKNHLDETKA